jgi:hypothetical protein
MAGATAAAGDRAGSHRALLALLGVGLRRDVCLPVLGAMEICRTAGAAPLHRNAVVLAAVARGAAGLARVLWAVRDGGR